MDKRGVIRSAGMVGGLTLVSRGLGFVRDVLVANYFGTTGAASAFMAAFRIPNLFRALFGEGALSAAFIPVFVETRQKEGDASAWALAQHVFTLVGFVLLLIMLGGVATATVALGRPGLDPFAELVWRLFRIMFPYVVFICLTAVAMGALNSFGHFAVPAAAPALLNVVEILVLLFVCPWLGATPETRVYGIAWGVIAAGALQLGVQFPSLFRLGFRPRLRWNLRDPRLVRMLTLMGPVAVGRAVTQVNVAIDTFLALAIGQWAAAALWYSERLIYLPLGIFATALSTVLLPLFSGQATRGDHGALRESVNHALRLLFFVMTPAAVGLFVLAEPVLAACYQRGEFTAQSTMLSTLALMCYAPGMIVFSAGKVFVPAFYGLQDPKTPVRIGVATVLLNIAMSVAFMVTWPTYYKHAGIACATVIAETLNGVALAWILHRRVGSCGWVSVARSAARTLACAVLMGHAVSAGERLLSGALAAARWPAEAVRIVSIAAAVAAGVGVYLLAARLLRSPELTEILDAVRHRRPRAPVDGAPDSPAPLSS